MLRIKVCGITRTVDAEFAANLGADALGFIFYEKSPRFITPQQAAEIVAPLPERIVRVAVCVRPEIDQVRKIFQHFRFDVLQIHGELNIAYLQKLKAYTVLPAISVGPGFSHRNISEFMPNSGAVLFDTKKAGHFGGTGTVFDWTLIQNLSSKMRIVLAGGLNSKNVIRAIKAVQPYAVDLNSGVETAPGIKDHKELLKIFTILKDKRGERDLSQFKNFPFS